MKINGEKFETRNEKVIPITRPSGNFFLIAEALDDVESINRMVDASRQAKGARKIVSRKPGQKSEVVDNTANRQQDLDDFRLWMDGIVVHSLKYITRDELEQTPLEEPEEGWGEVPEELRITVKTSRYKYPIEWETVDFDDPMTWANWRNEMRESKINDAEITRIANGCLEANSLTEASVEAAMDDFLSLPPVLVETASGQAGEPGSILSGEPASDAE